MKAWLLLAVCLVGQAAEGPRVLESQTSLELLPKTGVLRVALESPLAVSGAKVRVEWLDPADEVVTSGEATEALARGMNRVAISLPSPAAAVDPVDHDKMIWHRIRCRVEAPGGGAAVKQILSVSEIQSKLFALQLLGAQSDEGFVNVLVRTVHPVTEKPVAGVMVTAKWGELGTATATTTVEGRLRLRIPIPDSEGSKRDDVVVSAQIGDFVQEGRQEVEVELRDLVIVATDKEIYQPGQAIRIRGIARRRSGPVLANVPVRVTVRNGGNRLYRREVRTTRFGVWAAEWQLPESAATGQYWVNAEVTGMKGFTGSHGVTVSRYELPTFTVGARLDRPWSLSGQEAVIDVWAQYLFGRPVESGEVRVREMGGARRQIFQGKLERGKARVVVQPRTTVENIQEWFNIEVTDATGKTERTRIAVRWAKEPLTVEVLGVERLSSRVVVPLYVRATYADGSPAAGAVVDVALGSVGKELLRRGVNTNADGLARIEGVIVPAELKELPVRATVRDSAGLTGSLEEISDLDRAAVQMVASRTVLPVGGSVELRLYAESPAMTVYVAAISEAGIVDYKQVEIRNHRATVVFPYREEFDKWVIFQVHERLAASGLKEGAGEALASAIVFVPSLRGLTVSVRTEKREYRPGETVPGEVMLTNAKGVPVEGAVGLAVVDRAVHERARDFEERRGRDTEWWWEKLSQDATRDERTLLRLAIEALEQKHEALEVYFPSIFGPQPGELYWQGIGKQMAPVWRALMEWKGAGNDYPATVEEFARAEAAAKVSLARMRDPWGERYEARREGKDGWWTWTVWSGGPDRRKGTLDDVSVDLVRWQWFDHALRKIAEALGRANPFPRTEIEFAQLVERERLAPLLRDQEGRTLQTRFSVQRFRMAPYGPVEDDYPLLSTPRPMVRIETAAGVTVASFVGGNGDDPAGRATGIRGRVTDFSGSEIPGAKVDLRSPPGDRVIEGKTEKDGRFVIAAPGGLWSVRIECPGFRNFEVNDVPVVDGLLIGLEVRLEVGSVTEMISAHAAGQKVPTNSPIIASGNRKAAAPPPPIAGERVRSYFPETLAWMPLLETDKVGKAKVEFTLADSITTWDMRAEGSNVQGQLGEGTQEVRAFLPLFVDHAPPRTLTAGDEIELTAAVRNYLNKPQTVRVTQELSAGFAAVGNTGPGQATVGAGESAAFGFRVKATEAGGKGVSRIRLAGDKLGDAVERPVSIRPDGRRVSGVDSRVVSGRTVFALEVPDGKAEASLRVYPSLLAHVFENYETFLRTPNGCAEQTISSTYPNLLVLEFLEKMGVKDGPVRTKALGNLQRGYERLLGFQAITGGFGYFARAEMDAALTEYAVEFLTRASRFITVDGEALKTANEWMGATRRLEQGERAGMSVRDRAHLLRVYLGRNEVGKARELAAELKGMLQGGSFDKIAAPATAFHVWGNAARVETVAAVVSALEEAQAAGVVDARAAIGPAVEWLMARKNESGTWYSSHTSVAVLSALLGADSGASARGPVTVRVNDGTAQTVVFKDSFTAADVALGGMVKAGRNEFVVSGGGGGAYVSAAVRAAWYLPWAVADPMERPVILKLSYDKTAAQVGEAIECRVEARRRTGDGRGMMIAEIGLPPGVEVDRSSLSESRASRYEVEPDRVVLYLWPAGTEAVTVRFRFRLRFAMKAKAAPSALWDYYNPEARMEVAPEGFAIRSPR